MRKITIVIITIITVLITDVLIYSDFIINREDNNIFYPVSIVKIDNQEIVIFSVNKGISNQIYFYRKNAKNRDEKECSLLSPEANRLIYFYGKDTKKIYNPYKEMSIYPNYAIKLKNGMILIYGKRLIGYERFDGFIALFNQRLDLEKIIFHKNLNSRETNIVKCIEESDGIICLTAGNNPELIKLNYSLDVIKTKIIPRNIDPSDLILINEYFLIVGRQYKENGDELVLLKVNENNMIEDEDRTLFNKKTVYPVKTIINNSTYYILTITRPRGYYGKEYETTLLRKKNNEKINLTKNIRDIISIDNRVFGITIEDNKINIEEIEKENVRLSILVEDLKEKESLLKTIFLENTLYLFIKSYDKIIVKSYKIEI